MERMKKLPDAEFGIMKVVWANEPPVTANIIMRQHGDGEGWKVQTAISLLSRLVERGFLRTEKRGKERTYYPMVDRDEYLRFETGNFMKQFHNNSFRNLVAALHDGEALTGEDIDELLEWTLELKSKHGGRD